MNIKEKNRCRKIEIETVRHEKDKLNVGGEAELLVDHEEARVQHLLLRPAEFEDVVRCLHPLLHLGLKRPESSIFSCDQPSWKRSSGVSILFFTSALFSTTMQLKLPSIVHTRFTSSSFCSVRSIRLRKGVRSSLVYYGDSGR